MFDRNKNQYILKIIRPTLDLHKDTIYLINCKTLAVSQVNPFVTVRQRLHGFHVTDEIFIDKFGTIYDYRRLFCLAMFLDHIRKLDSKNV